MPSTARLLKHEKDRIVRAAVTDAVKGARADLACRENYLIEDLVLHVARSKKLVKELEIAQKLDRKWLSLDSSVRVYTGQYIELSVRSSDGPLPLLPKWINRKGRIDIDSRSELGIAITALEDDRIALKERETTLEIKVGALVRRATTANSLANLWPEGEAYWREYVEAARGRSRLPVVSPTEVNSLLGIPKEERVSA